VRGILERFVRIGTGIGRIAIAYSKRRKKISEDRSTAIEQLRRQEEENSDARSKGLTLVSMVWVYKGRGRRSRLYDCPFCEAMGVGNILETP